jgi:hypothetical protein
MDSQTVEGAPAAMLVDLERDNVEGDDETQTPESKRAKMTTADCWKFFTKLNLRLMALKGQSAMVVERCLGQVVAIMKPRH